MDKDGSNPWEAAQARLQEILDEHSYKNWFSQTKYEGSEDGCLVVSVPSQFFADWLRDHYMDAVRSCVQGVNPQYSDVRFVAGGKAGKSRAKREPSGKGRRQETAPAPRSADGRTGVTSRFNPRYTFERFVVGAGNRFAHAAARAVAESPARAYNPLFLYGGTGLGKTHLMQGIGQELLRRAPDCKVAYISSEDFTNELIESIAKKSTQRFRAKFRRVDVLLIDDVHFIGGKEATQEEFFHTFNALFDMHKQIVLSSDRQPKEIPGLEARLVSRFEWGLVTDIQPPDLETRVAILKNKAAEERFTVSADVLRYMATYITKNIRELEGALITLFAYARLTKQEITLPTAEEVLSDLIGRDKIRPTTVEDIQRAVAERFDSRISDLRGRSRQRHIAYPRQIAMYLCKELIPSMSLSEIGDAFGGKDHTTVLYAHQKIDKELKKNPETRRQVTQLNQQLRG